MCEVITACGGEPLHRSFPYAFAWPDLSALEFDAAVVVVRDWRATVRSQLKVGHVKSEEQAITNLRYAYPLILSQLHAANKPWLLVGYEALCQRPEATVDTIVAMVPGLQRPARLPKIRDENEKWLS